jgi:hypothetical protein
MVQDLLKKMKRFFFSRKTMIFYDFYYEGFAPRYGTEKGFVLEELQPEIVSELLPILDLQSRNETFFTPIFDVNESVERMNRGERCFFLKANGKMTNYIWFCPNDKYIPEIQCTLKLRPGELYVYNAYAVPEYRGKNFHVFVHDCARSRMIKAGFTREIIARMGWNARADHVLKKLNARALGSVTVGFFLSFRYVIKNFDGFELTDDAGPFELYRKLFRKIKSILKTPGAAASH